MIVYLLYLLQTPTEQAHVLLLRQLSFLECLMFTLHCTMQICYMEIKFLPFHKYEIMGK